jgi:xanthine dehydrogenase accessory factor
MNMDSVTVGAALSLLENGEGFAWLTIIDNLGSSPRHIGSSMLVRADGSIAGTIGGGALEGAAIRAAAQAIEARESHLMNYNLTNNDSAKLGMICGGTGVVLIDYIEPSSKAVKAYYTALLDLVESGRKGWAVIALPEKPAPGWTARNCLVSADGAVAGNPICSIDDLQELVKKGGTHDRIIEGRSTRTFVQPIGLQGAAYVFGAGHCGEKLVPVLSTVGFYTVVVDDRAEFANATRFPSADRIVVPDSFEGIVGQLPVDEDSYVVIITRGHIHDRTVLQQALETDAAYVGMIGSRKKVAETFRALTDEGVTPEDIARVHAPIGLSIGAETPEEIAISIAAELIQIRASRRA